MEFESVVQAVAYCKAGSRPEKTLKTIISELIDDCEFQFASELLIAFRDA